MDFFQRVNLSGSWETLYQQVQLMLLGNHLIVLSNISELWRSLGFQSHDACSVLLWDIELRPRLSLEQAGTLSEFGSLPILTSNAFCHVEVLLISPTACKTVLLLQNHHHGCGKNVLPEISCNQHHQTSDPVGENSSLLAVMEFYADPLGERVSRNLLNWRQWESSRKTRGGIVSTDGR